MSMYIKSFDITLYWIREYLFSLTLSQTITLQYKSFENTVGKGEIDRNEQFLLFPQCFPPFPPLSSNLKLSSTNFFSLEESKICRLGKGYQPTAFSSTLVLSYSEQLSITI